MPRPTAKRLRPAGRRSAGLWLGALLLGSCYAPPAADDPSAAAKIQRTFASDLSTTGFAERTSRLARLLPALDAELARGAVVAPSLRRAGEATVKPLESVPQQLAAAADAELQRPERVRNDRMLRPSPDRWLRRFRSAIEGLPRLFWLDHRPLGEPSDPEHRTDPHDARPEVPWWQRVARRLGL